VVEVGDFLAVASGVAAAVHSSLSGTGVWLQLRCFVYLCVLCGSSIFHFINHKGHEGTRRKDSGTRSSGQTRCDCIVELNQDDKRDTPISADDAE
jgi:hypothetical protein